MPKYILDEEKRGVKYSDYVDKKYLIDLPLFAQQIFSNKGIEKKEKQKFYKDFLINYLEDDNFRQESQDLMVFFYFSMYVGVFHLQAIRQANGEGYAKNVFKVTDNPEIGSLKILQITIPVSNGRNSYKLPKTEINFNINGNLYSETRLIDTGSNYSTIPYIEKWNYAEKNPNYLESKNPNIEHLRTNVDFSEDAEIETAGDISNYKKIYWKNPLILSLQDLPEIDIEFSIVPNKKLMIYI